MLSRNSKKGQGELPLLCLYKFDFAGTSIYASTEAEQPQYRTMSIGLKNNISSIGSRRRFVISPEPDPYSLPPDGLCLDEGTSQIVVMKSSSGTSSLSSPSENLHNWADLHWKAATYRLPRDDFGLLNIEILNKRNGCLVQRDLWKDIPVETKLSITKDILVFTSGNAYPGRSVLEDSHDRRQELSSSVQMVGNEQFVIVWSPVFLYIMSFDPAFRFEYDEVEFPKD